MQPAKSYKSRPGHFSRHSLLSQQTLLPSSSLNLLLRQPVHSIIMKVLIVLALAVAAYGFPRFGVPGKPLSSSVCRLVPEFGRVFDRGGFSRPSEGEKEGLIFRRWRPILGPSFLVSCPL